MQKKNNQFSIMQQLPSQQSFGSGKKDQSIHLLKTDLIVHSDAFTIRPTMPDDYIGRRRTIFQKFINKI